MGTWTPGPSATAGNDTYTGTTANENAAGLGGSDTITGGGGEDFLEGGDGDDVFVISATSHLSPDDTYLGDAGADTMRLTAAGAYNFAGVGLNSIETLTFTQNITANFLYDHTFTGPGPFGWTIDGQGRSATFNFQSVNDAFIQLGSWNFTNGNFTINITGGVNGDVLTGTNVADTINGGGGNDEIRGGAGTDTLIGGAGDDTYYLNSFVGDAADIIIEAANGGNDKIETDVSFSLVGYNTVENLEVNSSTAVTVTGNDLNNVLIGDFGADTLNGGAGDDSLFGGNASDTLIGGAGNDTYNISGGGIDVIIENPGEGIDTVSLTFSNGGGITTYSLAAIANVENINYLSINTTGTHTITGNSLNNVITAGGSPATIDTIDGGAGDDVMSGGAQADTYIVDSYGDVVIETLAGTTAAAIDTIRTALSAYTLSNSATSLVENLVYTGAGGFIGQGNDLANAITGGSGDDTLDGGAGADRLDGGGGNDTIIWDAADTQLTGGGGTDTLVFAIGTAPTSFGLAANGFEGAEGRLIDTGGNSWTSQTTYYDSAWLTDFVRVIYDNGARTELDHDQGNAFAWTTNFNEYDALGALDVNVTTYDTGVTAAYDYDQANAFNWISNWNQYAAGGALDINVTTYDDGIVASNDFDEAGAFGWSTNFNQYDALGQLDINVTVFDSGITAAYDFDQTSSFNWVSNYNEYAVGGALDLNVTMYDDASYAVNEYDELAEFDWTTNWESYDTLGRLDQNVVEYDNGDTAVVDYDQADQFTWASIWQLFDAGGNLIGYQGVNDDGSLFGGP